MVSGSRQRLLTLESAPMHMNFVRSSPMTENISSSPEAGTYIGSPPKSSSVLSSVEGIAFRPRKKNVSNLMQPSKNF
jgi:hypothetical protein